MTRMLLTAAGSITVLLSGGAAQAQSFSGSEWHSGGFVGRPADSSTFGNRDFRRDCFGDHCRRRDRAGETAVVMDWYGGEWARWNNQSWDKTGYNDWWHEAPSRAYPAWMSRNQDCSRPWYSGDTLRC